MSSVRVNFKWGKQVFNDVDIMLDEPVETLKLQLFSLTQVPIERQKIMGVKGGVLKDDANLATLGIKPGQTLMLMGSADEITAPTEKVVFVEDLAPAEMAAMLMAGLPPGLTNLGNTCYMNSCLQCLASVKDLSSGIMKLPVQANQYDPNMTLTMALRELFRQLSTSKQPVIPFQFLTVLRSSFPQFAERGQEGGFAQQDAEECLSQIMASITRVPGGSQLVDDIFGVDLHTELTREDDASDKSVELEKQNKLLCHIDEKISLLTEGLRRSMEGTVEKHSTALGRNAHFNKVSRVCKLPPYLFVQEVRFDWRPDTRQRSKKLRAVAFPMELDIIDLCTDALKEELVVNRPILKERRDKEIAAERMANKRGGGGRLARDGEEEGGGAAAAMDTSEGGAAAAGGGGATADGGGSAAVVAGVGSTGKYELCGVLTHQGRTADGGHYMGWIKHGPDSWHRFDDDRVSEVNDDEIKKLVGGGDWHMAYILLYKHIYA